MHHPSSYKKNLNIWYLVVCAVLIGLSVIVGNRGDSASKLTADALDYHNLAMQILTSHTYGSTYRVPVYPAFLALIYSFAGQNLVAVYLAQFMLFIAALIVTFKTCYYVTKSTVCSLLTVFMCIMWFSFWRSITEVLTEILALFLISVCVWFIIKCTTKPNIKNCMITGLLLALCVLCKAVIMPLVPIAALYIWLKNGKSKQAILGALSLLIVSTACLGMWTIRNYRSTGEFIPIATGGGFNLWLGNWPPYYHQVWQWQHYPPELQSKLAGKTEAQQDKVFTKETIRQITHEPATAIALFGQKFSDLWWAGLGHDRDSCAKNVSAIGHFSVPKQALLALPLFLLSLVGYFRLSADERTRALPITVLILWWTVVYVATTVAPNRYVIPIQTYEIMFAAIALQRIFARKSTEAARE